MPLKKSAKLQPKSHLKPHSKARSKSAQSKTKTSSSASHQPSTIGVYDRRELTKSLKIDAKALDIPPAAAEIFIEKTLDAVEKDLHPKKIVTERDLTAAIVKELKKFNPDFAYIYQNRDKII